MDTEKNYSETQTSDDSSQSVSPIRLSDLWRGVCRFWWLCILLAVLLAGVNFYRGYRSYTPVYKSTVTFTVNMRESLDNTGGISSYTYYYNRVSADMLSATFPYVLQNSIMQELICDALGTSYMPGSITASAVPSTNLFTLTASSTDPQTSYDILMAAIENYPKVAEYIIGDTTLTMLSEPVVPEIPSNQISYSTRLLKGAAAGLALGAVWILLYAYSRDTIRTKEDIRLRLRQNCVGVMPQVVFRKHKRKVINTNVFLTNPHIGTGFMESLRSLRNAVVNGLQDKEKILMVTSTAPGEGKTTITVNLAASVAALGKNVLLIDADLRNPSVKMVMEESGCELDVQDASSYVMPKHAVMHKWIKSSLTLITFHSEDKKLWNTLNHKWLSKWLKQFRADYDYIIIDTPPCGLLTDPAIIADLSDVLLYVIEQDAIRTSRIISSIETLGERHARIMGCVLNSAASGLGGYGDNYGYGRYYSKYGKYGKYSGYGQRSSEETVTQNG